MTIEILSTESSIPSHFIKILRTLVGCRVTAATRYSWWPSEQVERECGVKGKDIFSLTAGPVEIKFDSGMALGMASDPSKNSVCVWVESDVASQTIRTEQLAFDEDLYPISACNAEYSDGFWQSVVGARVIAISLLVKEPDTALLAELPNEVGLCFSLDSGKKIIAAHGLHDDSDDFAIISEDSIQNELRVRLKEIVIATQSVL